MRSPAVPPASRALRAALYSVGGVGLNSTLISGCLAVKAGMMVPVQMSASSLRQLSMVRVWASAAPAAPTASAAVASRVRRTRPAVVFGARFMPFLPVCGSRGPRTPAGGGEPSESDAQIAAGLLQQAVRFVLAGALQQQGGRLHAVGGAGERLGRCLPRAPRDLHQHGDGAVAQLGVLDPQIDHEPVIDPAE